jgi:hypothetical protein
MAMSTTEPETEPEIRLTGPGQQAYDILAWVQKDIPGRVAEGQKRLAPVIAATAGDEQARAEVSGVATYLTRYADA